MIPRRELKEAQAQIIRWRERPSTMVRELFQTEPDEWQADVLDAFPHKQRIAMLASKGPGKTTVLAWLAWNFLLTRPHPKIAATSVTGDNLNDGLWTEMAKWQQKSSLLQASFTWTKTRIFANENPETWWMAARTWPRSGDKEQQAETLAGLHADYIFFILDESGSIPEAVMVAAEAALASGIEAHIVQAGNPSALEGPLYAAHRNRKLWHVVEINGDPDNPKRSPRVSIDWAREQIAQYGRESPWVMVNVLGRFPSASLNALIGMEEIEAAQKRVYRESDIAFAPVILGVDVARFGDDSSCVYPRRGIQAFSPVIHRNLDSQAGAGVVTRLWDSMGADAVFIDNTGGFGAGWIDMLRQLGRAPIGVGFAERAHEPQRFANKRAEMYFDAARWIKEGGALPPDKQLAEAMTRTTYTFAKGQLLLEPKADVKAKLGYSPDSADAFCFVAGTMVATPTGHTPIEQLLEGDQVLTPFGVSRVAKKWVSFATRLTTIKTVCGTLTGRPEHEVFAYGRGLVPLSALSLTMALSPLSERSEWLASGSSTGARSIGFKTLVATFPHALPYTARECCIVGSGLSATDQSPKDMRFTTKTGIGGTLRSAILRFLHRKRMTLFTSTGRVHSAKNKKSRKDFFVLPETRRQSGIRPKLDESGTLNMGKILGLTENQWDAYALYAASHFGPITPQRPSIAPSLASRLTPIRDILLTFGLAIGVAKRSQQTATGKRRVVPESVQTENVLRTPVYNLTLETDNAYYANGILVFNCLTFAEPITAASKSAVKPRHEWKFDPFADLDRQATESYKTNSVYDPFGGR